MACQNKTYDFIRLRNSYVKKRPHHHHAQQVYFEDGSDQKKGLLNGDNGHDIELKEHHSVDIPPDWVNRVNDMQFQVNNVKSKLGDLKELHKANLLPGFHDTEEGEHRIEILTAEITKMFRTLYAQIKKIGTEYGIASATEKHLKKNAQSELARELQDLSFEFRTSQKNYLTALRNRERKLGAYSILDEDIEPDIDKGFTDAQMRTIENRQDEISTREKDILKIAASIQELASIFNDLAILVIDQGTILDRIDFNLEQTDVAVTEGVVELQKADKHSKGYRTKLCILMLIICIILMVIIVFIKGVAGRV